MSSTEIGTASINVSQLRPGIQSVDAVNFPDGSYLWHQDGENHWVTKDNEVIVHPVRFAASGSGTFRYNMKGNEKYPGFIAVDISPGVITNEASEVTTAFTITNIPQNLFNDVSLAQRQAGAPLYRCVFVHSVDAVFDAILYTARSMLGGDTLEIGIDLSGVNGTPPTLVDETDSANQLTGITWVEAANARTPLTLGNTTAADKFPVWLKYTPSNADLSANSTQVVSLQCGYRV
ncbi:MAG: hypothetical protein LPH21_12950 [Shewanella sp.]|nr:hypothetical protein [Shewanella sp.]